MIRHPLRLGSALALLLSAYACSNAEPRFDAQSSNDALRATATGAAAPGRSGARADARDKSGVGSSASTPDAGASADVALCGNAPCECNNGIDDDGDGEIDGADIECTGALDDEEKSFGTGIPGDNKDPKWQDCFFDGNSGHGDDRCRYPTTCLTGELSQDDPACAVTQACLDACFPRTPAGCDCFGCCTVDLGEGGTFDIRLTDSCTADTLGDSDACPVCTKSTQCNGDTPPPDPEDPETEDPVIPEDPVDPIDPEDPVDPTDPPVIR